MVALGNSFIVKANVVHARRVPVKNRFSYGIDYLLLDETLLQPRAGPKLYSFDKPNLVSLYSSDHGVVGCDGVCGVRQLVKESGIDDADRIALLVHPRYWGYTFNPVSFWLVYNSSEHLRAVVAEVHNTFGDRHAYLCCSSEGSSDINRDELMVSPKRFHVSPFFDIVGKYQFRFAIDDSRLAIHIQYDDGKGGGLSTSISGSYLPFTDRELVRALLRRPLGAMRTTALIHWQALRLWKKGVQYRKRPLPPEQAVTK